jgi:hypothetical protein
MASHLKKTKRARGRTEEKLNSPWRLVVGECPLEVFKGGDFEVDIQVVKDDGYYVPDGKGRYGADVGNPLDAVLIYSDTGLPVEGGGACLLQARSDSMVINGETGSTTVNLSIVELSQNNRPFSIQFSSGTISVTTPPIHVVMFKLHCVLTGPNNHTVIDNQDNTFRWYSAEGGKTNSMTLDVTLVGPNAEVVKGSQIPLAISLYYGCNVQGCSGHSCCHKVGDIDLTRLLEIKAGVSRDIDRTTGKAQFLVKITEVSRNHQKQAFIMRVTGNGTMAANLTGYSRPVLVCSKRRTEAQAAKLQQAKLSKQVNNFPPSPSRKRRPLASPSNESVSRANQIIPVLRSSLLLEDVDSNAAAGDVLHGAGWAQQAMQLMLDMQSTTVGFEMDANGQPDRRLPIRKCAYCRADTKDGHDSPHAPDCRIKGLLQTFPRPAVPDTVGDDTVGDVTSDVAMAAPTTERELGGRPSLTLPPSLALPSGLKGLFSFDDTGMGMGMGMGVPSRSLSNSSFSSFAGVFSPREDLGKDLEAAMMEQTKGQTKTTTPRQLDI